jgi:hypothetical protein
LGSIDSDFYANHEWFSDEDKEKAIREESIWSVEICGEDLKDSLLLASSSLPVLMQMLDGFVIKSADDFAKHLKAVSKLDLIVHPTDVRKSHTLCAQDRMQRPDRARIVEQRFCGFSVSRGLARAPVPEFIESLNHPRRSLVQHLRPFMAPNTCNGTRAWFSPASESYPATIVPHPSLAARKTARRSRSSATRGASAAYDNS